MTIKIKGVVILLSFFLLTINFVVAQTTIKGKVTDETGMPLPDVSVFIEASKYGGITDFNGVFVLELTISKATIIFSSLGFKTQRISVDNKTTSLEVVLEEDASQLKDVVITVNRTMKSSQKVAQSISVIGAKSIKRDGIKEFRDYASGISNLSFGSQGGDGGGRFSNEITIRGVSGDNTTAMYLNGSPLPENINPNLIDVSRIEILKGPQGTLYGSATMGGAIKVISNTPKTDKISGFVESEIANVKEGDIDYNIQGLLNIPITQKLAFRGSGYYNFQSGVYDRVINQDIERLNEDFILTEDFYGDTEDFFGNPFSIETNGCAGCSRENKENVDDRINYGFNANLGFYPTENLSIIATVIYQQLKGDGYDFAEVSVDSFIQNSNTGLDESFKDEWTNYSLQAELETSLGNFNFSSNYLNRGYIETEDASDINTYFWVAYEDEPGIEPLESIWASTIDRSVETDLFQQEIRFNSDFEGRFNFLAGAFYSLSKEYWNFNNDSKGFATYLLADNTLFEDAYWGETAEEYTFILNNNDLPWYTYRGDFEDSEFALFGQFYYDISDQLKFTLGLRYFKAVSEKSIKENGAELGFVDQPFSTRFSEGGINPKFNLTYKINKDKLVYATVVRGFRIGDSNELLPLISQEELEELDGEFVREFEADYLWNYELGFKSIWLNGKVIVNMSIFYNDWSNLQQYRLLPSGWGYTANVGSAHTSGIEIDFRNKVSKNFDFSFGLGLLDAEIDEGSSALTASKNDKILNSPSVTANLNTAYSKVLGNSSTLYASVGMQYVGKRFGTYQPELEPELIFPEYTLLNARVGYLFSNMELSIFGKNLTNKQANFGSVQSFSSNLPGRPRYSTNRPITIGVNFKYGF